ncbi:MAG TPA: hypothetical protein VKB33_06180 [Nitrospira sp.]|nr:hypothetical protein [Nitrospira sp.]
MTHLKLPWVSWFPLAVISAILGCSMPEARAVNLPETRAGTLPELPREWVDTQLVAPTGRTLIVKAGDDLQEALELAQPGDEIVLEAGATFKGPFTLPNKGGGSGWIIVRTSVSDREFPGPGTRVGPPHGTLMPKLTSSRGDGVVIAEPGAHHYRFIGLEVTPAEGTHLYSLMWFGHNSERTVNDLPHHIIVDRCYIHGDPKKGSRRGVALNGRHIAVIDSYVSDFKEVGADSQALMGWGGSGPFKIVNNYLEGAGENIFFGGGDPTIRDLVPSDIEIRHNHVAKPLSWKRGEPGYAGTSWSVKNLFELKNARRVVADGNILEYNWEESQNGFAVLLTVRNQDGRAPWSVVEDVRFTNNIIRHSGSGLNLLGRDDNQPSDRSQQTKRILIQNNLWEDIGGARWGGRGILFQVLKGSSDVTIERNTGLHQGYVLFGIGPPHRRLTFKSNIAPHNEFGIFGDGVGTGTAAIEAYFPDAVVTDNVLAGGDDSKYPEGNFFPDSLEAIPFVDRKAGDYRLAGTGIKTGRKSRTDLGVDMTALCAALGSQARGQSMCAPRTMETRSRTTD